MTEGRQPFTAEIKTLAKGPSTYDPLENNIGVKRTSTIAAVYVVGKAAPCAIRSTEVCDAAMARNIRKAAQAAP